MTIEREATEAVGKREPKKKKKNRRFNFIHTLAGKTTINLNNIKKHLKILVATIAKNQHIINKKSMGGSLYSLTCNNESNSFMRTILAS